MQTVNRSFGNRNFNNRDSNRDGGFAPQQAPVKVGDELDATIEGVGEKGDGFTRKDGFVLFVTNVQKGDNVRIRVNKVLRKVGFAEVIGQASGAPATTAAPAPSSEAPAPAAPEKPADSEEF